MPQFFKHICRIGICQRDRIANFANIQIWLRKSSQSVTYCLLAEWRSGFCGRPGKRASSNKIEKRVNGDLKDCYVRLAECAFLILLRTQISESLGALTKYLRNDCSMYASGEGISLSRQAEEEEEGIFM